MVINSIRYRGKNISTLKTSTAGRKLVSVRVDGVPVKLGNNEGVAVNNVVYNWTALNKFLFKNRKDIYNMCTNRHKEVWSYFLSVPREIDILFRKTIQIEKVQWDSCAWDNASDIYDLSDYFVLYEDGNVIRTAYWVWFLPKYFPYLGYNTDTIHLRLKNGSLYKVKVLNLQMYRHFIAKGLFLN